MKITIDSDAAHFHQYNSMSYAFVISWDNIKYKESWYIPVNVSSSTEAEFISVWKAIDYLYDKWVNYQTIIVKCDNIWVTIEKNKFYWKDNFLPYILILRKTYKKYHRLIKKTYWATPRFIYFHYAQARKWIDESWMNKRCDKECKRIWRRNIPELYIKIKLGAIKCKINDWIKAIIPKKWNYKKCIERFYEREYKDY